MTSAVVPAQEQSKQPSGKRPRIDVIDALRGLALSGIHIINVYQQVALWKQFHGDVSRGVPLLPVWVKIGFYERFFPVFALLFGVSFGLFLDSAANRTAHPRWVLARRLVFLLLLGLAHQVFHRGEALTPYAVFGLVFLLPASFLGGWAVLVLALVLLVVGGQVVNGYGVMPGMLVLGLALHRLGVTDAVERRPGRWAIAAVTLGAVVAADWWAALAGVRRPWVGLLAANLLVSLPSVATGLLYCCGFLLLARTPLRSVLVRWLAPMGRMALTNYLAATAIMLIVGPLLGIDNVDDAPRIIALTLGIIVIESIWSPLWLRRFVYGPFEWVWRWATWGKRPAFHRKDPNPGSPVPAGAVVPRT